MLDRQTPNIQVITNRRDDVDDKTSVNAHAHAQTQEQKRHVVPARQRARPTQSERVLQKRAKAVEDAVDQRQDENVVVRKA